MSELKYPRFISNKPHGIDYYEGESANKIALALKNHIETVSETNTAITDKDLKLSQIIGLEGTKGSGKSNVIKKLKSESKGELYVFEYDAWSHQEDLQRRSFLEALTDELITCKDDKLFKTEENNKNKVWAFILKIKHSIKSDNNKTKSKLETKLSDLLTRKRVIVSRSSPKFNIGIFGAFIIFIFTPIASIIANDKAFNYSLLYKALILLTPTFISISIWLLSCIIKWEFLWGELFSIQSKDKIESTVNESISENEPTIKEFKNWMIELSIILEKKLIIVFDNMDRLPSAKVKELWSSIFTFFAENDYTNIWVIIPYDKEHLYTIYKEDNATNNADQFITKVFPVVYRVNPPVTTNRKKIFFKYFEEAFGNTEDKNKEKIQKIFDTQYKDKELTPRNVIFFINELVAIIINNNEISLVSIGLFILSKDDFTTNPANYILKKEYHSKYKRIIENTDELQTEIAALFYGVSKKMAGQIPLMKYIEDALNKGTSINEYSTDKHFDEILTKQIEVLEIVHIDDAVKCMQELNDTDIITTKQWNLLAKIFIDEKIITSLKFEDYQKRLLVNAEINIKKKIIKHLINRYQNIDTRDFDSKKYYIVMNDLDETIIANKIELDFIKVIPNKEIEAKPYIDYVILAKKKHTKFKLICNKTDINNYLIQNMSVVNSIKIDFFKIIKESDVNYFMEFKTKIEDTFDNDENIDFTSIIEVYKIISDEKPLKKQLNFKQLIMSINNNSQSKPSIDRTNLNAMNLILNTENFEKGYNPPNQNSFIDFSISIANQIEYFIEYGDLIKLSLKTKSETLKQVIKHLTEHTVGYSKINIKEILPRYKEISSYFEVPEEVLLKRFANCKFNPEDLNDPAISELIRKENIIVFKEEKETIKIELQH